MREPIPADLAFWFAAITFMVGVFVGTVTARAEQERAAEPAPIVLPVIRWRADIDSHHDTLYVVLTRATTEGA